MIWHFKYHPNTSHNIPLETQTISALIKCPELLGIDVAPDVMIIISSFLYGALNIHLYALYKQTVEWGKHSSIVLKSHTQLAWCLRMLQFQGQPTYSLYCNVGLANCWCHQIMLIFLLLMLQFPLKTDGSSSAKRSRTPLYWEVNKCAVLRMTSDNDLDNDLEIQASSTMA